MDGLSDVVRAPAPPPAAGARQGSLRETNLGTLMRQVCASEDDLSRADLAARLGMTRATAARLVDELVDAGLLDERVPPAVGSRSRGRPAKTLAPGGSVAGLGLQVDTDGITALVLALDGTPLGRRSESLDVAGADPSVALRRIRDLGAAVLDEVGRRVVGAAIAVPGLVVDGRTVQRAPNLGWSDLDVRSGLGAVGRLDEVSLVGNEADLVAAAVVLERPGRVAHRPDLVLVSGSHGIGGAVVRQGQVAGDVGEIGHVCVDPAGPACPCGSVGCLEQYVGLDAIAATAGVATKDVDTLGSRADSGDESARATLDQAAWALSIALGSVLNVVGLDVVALGGHLGRLEPWIGPDLQRRLGSRVLRARWLPVVVRAAGDAQDSPARGAALAVLDRVVAAPASWL